MAAEAVRTWRRPPVLIKDRRWRWGIYAFAVIYLVLAVSSVEVNWARVYEGLERGWRFLQGFLVPDFTSRWRDIGSGLVESLTMTVTSTIVGVLLAIPVGIGAARNLAPLPVYLVCRKSSSPSCSSRCSASDPLPAS